MLPEINSSKDMDVKMVFPELYKNNTEGLETLGQIIKSEKWVRRKKKKKKKKGKAPVKFIDRTCGEDSDSDEDLDRYHLLDKDGEEKLIRTNGDEKHGLNFGKMLHVLNQRHAFTLKYDPETEKVIKINRKNQSVW